MSDKSELLPLDVEMPKDDGSEPRVVKPDQPKPGVEPDMVLDPSFIASSSTPDEIRAALENLPSNQGEVVDDKK